jgi:hypothetical protein
MRTLLAVQSSERTASGGTDNTRRTLSTERDVPRRMAEKLLSRRTSQLEVLRRVSTERQSSSRTTPERRTLAEADVTRRMPTERQAYQRTAMERRMSEVYGSRRMLSDSQPSQKLSIDRRVSAFDFPRRMSTERRYTQRMSMDHIIYESDTTRKLSGERQSEGRMSTESRISEPHVSSTTSVKRGLSKRMLTEHMIIKFDPSRRISTERQSSRRLAASDRVSEMRSGSRVSSERSFSETRLYRGSTLNSPQDDSRKTHLARISSERAQVSWHSTKHLGFERQSSSRRMQAEERRANAERSSSRRDETGRRTTRSISSQTSADRRDSRMLQSFHMTSRSSTTGRLFEERRNVRISHERLFHSTPSVQHLSSLASKQKQNETQSSESVSRISADRQNVRKSNGRLSSKISHDHTEASVISNKLLSTVSRTRLSPPRKSTDHTPASRIADNRRISAISNERTSSRRTAMNQRTFKEHRSLTLYRERMFPLHLSQEHLASEERHKIRLNRERQPLLSESSGRHASFRTAKERRISSDRSSPLDTILTTRISEERRNSRTSPTTYGLFTTSGRSVSDSRSGRQSSEFTASRSMSNEKVIVQWSKLLSRQNALLSGSIGRRFTEMPISRNNRVTDSATRQSIGRSSEERASTFRDSRTMYAERLATLKGSKRVSCERLAHERDSKSTERLASLRHSRRISAERRTSKRESESSAENLACVRESRRTSTERLRSEKDSRSAERLAVVSSSRRISTVQLTPKTVYSRSAEHLASVWNSKRISASLRHSRTSAERLIIQRDSRSAERLTPLRDPRKTSTERLATQRDFRESFEHLTYVKDSRKTPTERLATQRSTEQSERFVSQIDSIRSSERAKSNRNSRIIAERVASTGASRRISTETLTHIRDSRKTSSIRGSRRMIEGSTFVTRYRISPTLLETARNSRVSVERLVSVRLSRRTSTEHLSIHRSPRSADRIATILDMSRTSAKQLVSERSSRHSVEGLTSTNIHWVKHLASVRISKISAERLASDRHLVDHFVSVRDFRRSSTEKNSRQSNERLATMMDSRRIYAERLATERDYRQPFEGLASLKNARRLPTEGLSSVRNSRRTSVNQLRNSVGMVYERRSVSRKSSPDSLGTRRLMTTAFTRTILSDRHISQLKPLSTIHITSKALKGHGTTTMLNVRKTGLSDGHISKNLDQGLRLSEKQFITVDNTTLKTESSLDIGLLLGTVQKSIVNFSPAQYSSWSDNAVEYIRCALATLTVMWPSLAIWKGGVPKSLTSFDVGSALSSEMDHLNSFFADKVHFTNFS